jgi:DNA-directed RNA polymerase specialized sigma24 family protein
MARYSNQQLISSIKNGEQDVLFYITKKYYQSARRWLRRNGHVDADTPVIFSRVLVNTCREIQGKDFSLNVDFEKFFFNSLHEYNLRPEENELANSGTDVTITANCFSILDETSRKILADRYVEGLSFEEIADRRNFSNSSIAQFECDKAFYQLENITKVRLNLAE